MLAARNLRAGLLLALALTVPGCGARGPVPPAAWDPDSIPNAYARPQAALALPGATRAFQVREDGSLYDGAWSVALHLAADGDTAGATGAIACERRWCPVVRWHRDAGAVRWAFEAVAFAAPAPADTQLFASLEVVAVNRGSAAARCTLSAALAPPRHADGWLAVDGPPSGAPLPAWDAAVRLDGADAASGPRVAFTLAPGARRTLRLVLATYPDAALAARARVPHAERVGATRRGWTDATSRGLVLELGDAEVEDAVRAARVVLLTCRERHGGDWLPTGGPFQYHDVWLRDGARAVAALAVAGHTREARELASGFARFQWPHGVFLSQRGQLDGNGQALWAFAQAALRPAPDSTVARFAEMAYQSAGAVYHQYELGTTAPWPLARLLPFAEPRDDELVRAQLVGNDAWSLAGLESASRLLRAAHRDEDAGHVDSLRMHCREEVTLALAPFGSGPLPPSWQGAGRDWGNLAAGWPCRMLDAGDARLLATATRAWGRSDAPGLVSYGAADSVHGYLGADLGTWALLADRPADAHRVLEALLHWRDGCGGGAEFFSASTREFGSNFPPHPTCAAALVAIVRNALVYDDGDTLQLTLGPRPAWWSGAHVRGAPTRWGTLDLRFSRAGDRAQWQWTAVPVWCALRLPAGTVLAARATAPCIGAPGDRVVLAPPGTTAATAALAPAGGAR